MLTTKNYKLKKPELTDSPPDITVMNPNWDLVDEKLFAVIHAWEDFKANGGEIGGTIYADSLKNIYALTSGEKERSYYFGSLNNFDPTIGMEIIDKKSGFDTKVELAQAGNPSDGGQGYFGSSHDNKTNLGSDVKRWKDVWVGASSKGSSGYTKLPNGLILQWGSYYKQDLKQNTWQKVAVTFPLTWANNVFSLMVTTSGHSRGVARDLKVESGDFTASAFDTWINPGASAWGGVMWMAIGC